MGEARRKKQMHEAWPEADRSDGTIDLHVLSPHPPLTGARINELTGEVMFSDDVKMLLRTFRAVVGKREFLTGFCVGDGEAFTPIGLAVIERLSLEAPYASLHVVRVKHEDIAWDMVLRHLRTFTGEVLLFAFPDSDVYDAGTAEIHYSKWIKQFDHDGKLLGRLSQAQKRKVLAEKAAVLDRPPPPKFYPAGEVDQEVAPWIFGITTPAGKQLRTAVWNGRRDYVHEIPRGAIRWVGGEKIAIVQVDSPVGVNRRSSLDLTHRFSAEFDGIIHWARDSETFESILRSFIRLDLDTVSPPELPDEWDPEIVIFGANSS